MSDLLEPRPGPAPPAPPTAPDGDFRPVWPPAEREAALTLAALPGIGPRRFWSLIEAFGTPSGALKAPAVQWEAVLRTAGGGAPPAASRQTVDPTRLLAEIRRTGAVHLVAGDPAYPPFLLEIPQPPPVLYVMGDPATLSLPGVAIVGTRRASPYGLGVARLLARDLAGAGLVIVSGLARGIDTSAHRGALDAGGRTVTVLASGPDVTYPPENRNLKTEILKGGGAVVSLDPPGTPPDSFRFPARNRIISGLSLGVVVVEAPARSGALLTAGHALEQNREVMAVPGLAGSRTAEGCHALIREGATLVTSAGEVIAALPDWAGGGETSGQGIPWRPPAAELPVLAALADGPLHADQVVRRTGLPPRTVAAILARWELDGKVIRLTDGRYFRWRPAHKGGSLKGPRGGQYQ